MSNSNLSVSSDFYKIFYNKKADKNGNGEIDKEEAAVFLFSDEAKSAAALYSEGNIDLEEFEKKFNKDFDKKYQLAETIKLWDKNQDNEISLDEIPNGDYALLKNVFAGTKETFSIEELLKYQDLVDTDNDGKISADEKKKFGNLVSAEKAGSYSQKNIVSALQKAISNTSKALNSTEEEIIKKTEDGSIYDLKQIHITITSSYVEFSNKTKIKLKTGESVLTNDDGTVDIISKDKKSGTRYDNKGKKIGTLTRTLYSNGKLKQETLKKSDGKIVKDFNGKGQNTKQTTFYSNGKTKASYSYTYFSNGKLKSTAITKYKNDGKKTSYSYSELNSAGKEIKNIKETYKNGKKEKSIENNFDSKGQKTSIKEQTYEKGVLSLQTISKYKNGLVSEQKDTKYVKGKVTKTRHLTFKYDSNNNKISETAQIKDPKNKVNVEIQKGYTNNKLSSLIKKFDIDGNGKYEKTEDYTSILSYLSGDAIWEISNITNATVSDRLKDDIKIVQKAEQAGLKAGKKGSAEYQEAYDASIKAQMIKTTNDVRGKAGEVIKDIKKDGVYVNDGKKRVKLNISAETYLKLFPPIARYDVAQKTIGDCQFVSGCLIDMMKNPKAFSILMQKISEDEKGNITINFGGELSKYPVTFKKGELKTVDGLVNGKPVTKYTQVVGAKGLVMLEQAYAIAKFAQESKKPVSKIDIDAAIPFAEGGYQSDIYSEILGLSSSLKYSQPNEREELGTDVESFLRQNADAVNSGKMLMSVDFWEDVPAYDLYNVHAYSIEKIDTKNKRIYLTNPWCGGTVVAVPFDEFKNLKKAFNTCKLA